MFLPTPTECDALRRQHDWPCLGTGLWRAGETHIAVSGTAKAGCDTPAPPAQRFQMASCGKAVTALLMHRLAVEGLLDLAAPLGALLPDMELHADYRAVTAIDLLTHGGGLPANIADPAWQALKPVPPDGLGSLRRTLLADILRAPAAGRVGRHAYSNVGYMLLGIIAANVTGQPYEDLVRNRIFQPLHMDATDFYSDLPEPPWAHLRVDGRLVAVRDDNHPVANPAGTIAAPLGDWLKFLRGTMDFQRRHPPAPARRLPGGQRYTPYAFVEQKDGLLFHNGSNTLSCAAVMLLPARDVAVVAAASRDDGSPALNDLALRLARQP